MSVSADEGAKPPRFAPCAAGDMRCVLPVVDTVELVREVAASGVRHVQLRVKDQPSDVVMAAVVEAQAACGA